MCSRKSVLLTEGQEGNLKSNLQCTRELLQRAQDGVKI